MHRANITGIITRLKKSEETLKSSIESTPWQSNFASLNFEDTADGVTQFFSGLEKPSKTGLEQLTNDLTSSKYQTKSAQANEKPTATKEDTLEAAATKELGAPAKSNIITANLDTLTNQRTDFAVPTKSNVTPTAPADVSSNQTGENDPGKKSRRTLWIVVILLFLLFGLIGFAAKKVYDGRLADIEQQNQAQNSAVETDIDQLKDKVSQITVDSDQAGGDVVVSNGSGAEAGSGSSSSGGSPGIQGVAGARGADGASGPAGATGATGPQGPQGPSGVASCPNGNCLSLQASTPGVQESGSINISGDGLFAGDITAATVNGNGSGLTNLDASNVSSGTLNDSRLSANVTLQGNTFNGINQLVQLNGSGILPILDGSQLTNVLAANSLQLGGQGASYYLNASNLNSGTLSDALLSSNVTLQGNTFNGPNQLVKLTAGGILPVLNGSQLTNVDAQTLNGQLAAYYLNAGNLNAGTLADARLSANVALKNATNTFTGTNNFAGVTATGILQNGFSVCDTSNNCSYAAASGSGNYIQNQTASAQTAGFSISGNATIAGVLSSPGAGANSQKLGVGAVASGTGDVAIGTNSSATGSGATAVGTGATASTRGVAIGQSSYCGDDSVAIGVAASCGAGNASVVAIGKDAKSTASGAVVIGRGASTAYSQTIAISTGVLSTAHSPTASGQLVIADVNQGYFGNGVTSTTPNNFTFNATGGSGANIQGGTVTIAGGRGTGSAVGGDIIFSTAAAGSAGSALNPLTERMRIAGNGAVTVASGLTAASLIQGSSQVCDISNNCSYASATGGAGYIQNGTAQQIANFNISGNGVIGGNLTVAGIVSSPGGANSERFGAGSSATGTNSLAIGANATTGPSNNNIALGSGANVAGAGGTAVGRNATVSGGGGTAIGDSSSATTQSVSIGSTAVATGNSIAIGRNSTASGTSVVIGQGASNSGNSSIALGSGTTNTAANVFVAGSSTSSIQNVYFGNGVTDTAPVGYTINGTGGSGTDIQGGNVTIAGGRGTGAADGGSILFQTSSGSSSGSTLRALTTKAQIFANGNMTIGDVSITGARLAVVNNISAQVGLIVQGSNLQSGNLQEWRNGSGAVLAGVNSSGVILANAGINSTGNLVLNSSTNTVQLNSSGILTFGSAKVLARNGSSGTQLFTGSSTGALTVRNAADTSNLLVVQDSTGEITFNNNVRGYNIAVTSSSTSSAVVFGTAHTNANYTVMCTPNWNTTCFVTNKSVNGFTLNFGTAAPGAQLVDWFVAH